MCVFCKIIAGEIVSKRVYEDDEMIVINDAFPQAKVHLLAIPKEHFADITAIDDKRSAVVGRMIMRLGILAKEFGLDNGFRIISNTGEDGCQSIKHLHFHLIGGQKLTGKMG